MTAKVAALFILTASLAYSGLVGLLTQETHDWAFIQSVGGMKVTARGKTLIVDCDVSGTRKVTVKPSMVNSALAVRKVRHQRVGDTIQLTIVTSVIEKGMKTSCKPLDLSAYPAGTYKIQYLNPDGTTRPLGKVILEGPEAGERVPGEK